jgi:hypothetical protein
MSDAAPPGYLKPIYGTTLRSIMIGRNPMSPDELDALAADPLVEPAVAATMSLFGAAAAAAASRPVPHVRPDGNGNYLVGLLAADGATFTSQFSTVLGGYARILAYGWETPSNGLADVRRALGITLAIQAPQPVG